MPNSRFTFGGAKIELIVELLRGKSIHNALKLHLRRFVSGWLLRRVVSGARFGLQRRLLRIFSHEDEQIRVRLAQKLSQFAALAASLLAVPQQALSGYLGRQLCQLPAAIDEHRASRRLPARPLFVDLRHHVFLFVARAFFAFLREPFDMLGRLSAVSLNESSKGTLSTVRA